MDRITTNPAVMTGKPTIRCTRLTVEHLLLALSTQGFDEIKAEYPFLEKEDVTAALRFAAERVSASAELLGYLKGRIAHIKGEIAKVDAQQKRDKDGSLINFLSGEYSALDKIVFDIEQGGVFAAESGKSVETPGNLTQVIYWPSEVTVKGPTEI